MSEIFVSLHRFKLMVSDASDGLSLGKFEIFWLDDLIRDSVHSRMVRSLG